MTNEVHTLHIDRCDHIVLTVADVEKTVRFYEALGMKKEMFGAGRIALVFGTGKINLHPADGTPILPRAARPTPGSGDLCFIVSEPVGQVAEELKNKGITVEQGPVRRTGAFSPLLSIYVRDPDGNLIELANPVSSSAC